MEALRFRLFRLLLLILSFVIFIYKCFDFSSLLAFKVGYELQMKNIFGAMNLPITSSSNIIIVTYMRSGSTLLGEIFKHHPDVFYFYEPFRRIQTRLVKLMINFNRCSLPTRHIFLPMSDLTFKSPHEERKEK